MVSNLLKVLFTSLFVLGSYMSHAQQKTKSLSDDGHMLVTAPVIEKEVYSKRGEPTGRKELYLRLSMQDFYIKFCESKVKREDLQPMVTTDLEDMKTAQFEIEIRDGNWDQCGEDDVASRIGKYVVVYNFKD